MNDREIFKENLNYYLNKYDKMQKDLAEYVGAKTTTVSGWTRGISYPRADAMERIAMFFGIKTSQLVGKRSDEEVEEYKTSREIMNLAKNLSKLSPEQIQQATNVIKAMFPQNADLFEGKEQYE